MEVTATKYRMGEAVQSERACMGNNEPPWSSDGGEVQWASAPHERAACR